MKKRNKHNKYLLLLASLALIVTAVIGTTLAYLVSSPPAVTNTFTPGEIKSEIHENLSNKNKTKSNVTVKNTGKADAYIRAKVVITWQDTDGNVLAEQPVKGTDYTINGSPDSGWFESDGFYYWDSKVVPDGVTGVLIQKLEQKTEKTGYYLHVEILSEAIQADGVDSDGKRPVELAWGVTVNPDGTISK